MSLPERSATPRDDRTGWEPQRPAVLCPCGRVVVTLDACAWCLHAAHAAEKAVRP